jgi:hypothetical protein
MLVVCGGVGVVGLSKARRYLLRVLVYICSLERVNKRRERETAERDSKERKEKRTRVPTARGGDRRVSRVCVVLSNGKRFLVCVCLRLPWGGTKTKLRGL